MLSILPFDYTNPVANFTSRNLFLVTVTQNGQSFFRPSTLPNISLLSWTLRLREKLHALTLLRLTVYIYFLINTMVIIKADSMLDRDLCSTSNSRFLMTSYEDESAESSL